jgi:hypothetical protein
VTTPGEVYLRRLPLHANGRAFGRHVQHDPRSLRYAHGVMPRSALVAQSWTRRCGVLDQGSVGSCCGNAAAGWVGTDNATRQGSRTVDEDLALKLYSLATQLDEFDGEYPPTDSGSSGIGAAKALRQAGFCSGFTHGFTLAALATALQSGPVMAGTVWYNSMSDPDSDGRILLNTGTGVAGGHEYVIDGFEPASKPPDDRYWMTQSWGIGWGLQGRAYFTGADLTVLLSNDGDVTVPTPLTAPAPAPTDADQTLATALRPWVTQHHVDGNARAAKAAAQWLAAKGL